MEKEVVKKIAETARLQLTEEEIEKMCAELESILEHFSKIKDIGSGDEMYYVHESENPMRDDEEKPKDGSGIKGQFTASDKGYLLTPKLIK